jgi:hypothetical protein
MRNRTWTVSAIAIVFLLPALTASALSTFQVVQGGTGSTTLTGILLGNGSSPVQSLTLGSGLLKSGTTLSVSGLTATNFTSANVSQFTNDSGYLTSLSGAASSTLLRDNNTFSGTDAFSNTVTGSVSGNAGTATTLQNARTINGISFDGSGNITVTAASSTLLSNNNTFGGSNIFTNAPKLGSLSGLIAGNSGVEYAVSTTSMNASITGSAGSVANSLTFNNGGSGAASGQTYNGSSAATISYNTLGAVPATRNVNTSGALTGGGALSADLTLSVSNNGITNALLAQAAAHTLKGNNTGSTANVTDISTSTLYGTCTGGQVIGWSNTIGGLACIATSTTAGGSGTVTSVGLSSTNSTLTVGSSPVTTSGTITADLNLAHSNTWTATQNFATLNIDQFSSIQQATNQILYATSTQQSIYVGLGTAPAYSASAANNTFVGWNGGHAITSGADNIELGSWSTSANANITSGSNNILIGFNNSITTPTGNGQLNIANILYGTGNTGTGLTYSTGKVGVGSSSPWARLSIHANNGDGNTTLFAIGSSTANATSTLFSVSNTGNITLLGVQPATSTAITLDWAATGPQVEYRIGYSATTITIINATTSQQLASRKLVWICNPAQTAGALTWVGVEWIGTAPAQTTTSNQCDVYSFDITLATSSSIYKVAGTTGTGFQ